MMYNNKLAVAIKHKGKVLREDGDKVYLPFGSEYSIYIKNLHTVRAIVSISIDGEDITDGEEFVVYPNSDIEIERFIRNGNQNIGNRFKFIERTGSVEDYRGVGVEDGLVRVEYKFEKKPEYFSTDGTGIFRAYNNKVATSTTSFDDVSLQSSYTSDVKYSHVLEEPDNDAGITVEGSISDQQFQTVESFPTELRSHVMVIKLLGQTESNVKVRESVTVKHKPKCKTCGCVNKATAKFCTECGTSLQIVA